MANNSGVHTTNGCEDNWADDDLDMSLSELGTILDNPIQSAAHKTIRPNEQYAGFDKNAGSTWMYPNNMPLRTYQYSITQAALYKNTLVVLPTGLGKTFIAAVVMYNMYRWYPTGKVIFIAPTRPLVNQQIEACKKIMPFPSAETVELTGKLSREKRLICWRDKRVFFATPQALQSDMFAQHEEDSSNFPFEQVKLIVVDEAHRAKGRYAYVEVIQALHQRNKHFRVLALSATPGRTIDDVVEVVRNLLISHIEVRWETSIDVMQYIHKRNLKTVVVPYGERIQRVRERMIQIIDPYMRQLIELDAVSGSHQNISRNFLIMEQKRFREHSLRQGAHAQQSTVSSNFSICISLFHALELLERHGLRVFLNSFDDDEEGRQKFVLSLNPSLRHLVDELRSELGPNPFDISAHNMTNGCMPEIPKDLDFGHPKFEEARKCLLLHFEQNPNSRAIIFCEYRESVMMIYRLLLQHEPVLRPRCFVGSSSKSGCFRALSQKQQIQIMNDFRAGKNNILIATSIAEEGIDVGEVDLILCFDINTANPIRFIQRIGRTARQKSGKVITLVTEGKEQKILQGVMANKDQLNKKLLRSSILQAAFFKNAPRMVPMEFQPECLKIHVQPSVTPEKLQMPTSKAKGTRKEKKQTKNTQLVRNTQDLRKFFKKCDNNIAYDVDDDHGDEDDNDVQHDDGDFEPTTSQKYVKETPIEITQNSKARIERLFKNIQPCYTSNTQLLEATQSANETTANNAPTTSKRKLKLDIKHLKKINKFLRSSQDAAALPIDDGNLLFYLQKETCSKAAKLYMLKKSFKKVKEICEQIDILQALHEHEASQANGLDGEMSTHEIEIRETYQKILDLFGNRLALQRFLEDAELDTIAVEKRKLERNAQREDYQMTKEHYQRNIKQLIFKGLDLQGPSWSSFDYRQQALKQTEAYQHFLATDRQKSIQILTNDLAANSMVFAANTLDSNTYFQTSTAVEEDNVDGVASENLNGAESKYCSQWERDFQPNCVITKSTPNDKVVLSEIFQRHKQTAARKRLEPIEDEVDRPPLLFETSCLQRQQSTPINQKQHQQTKPKANNLCDLIDVDFESIFSEPFPVELALESDHRSKAQDEMLKCESLKENAKQQAVTTETLKRASIFDVLEKQPVNSLLTPKRSFERTTPVATATTSSMTLNEISSINNENKAVPESSRTLPSPKNDFNVTSYESPQKRKTTIESKNAYEKSPSIFHQFTKGAQRLESRRKLQVNRSDKLNTTDLDSPLIRKRKRRNDEMAKAIIVDSDTTDDGSVVNLTPTRTKFNSDDDFEEVGATPQSKRRCFKKPKRNSKPARLCEFFYDEAEKSGGSGHSDDEDEAEDTLGDFVCDNTMIEVNDEDAVVGPTQMQAVYLQSVRSPNQRKPGGFKIPTPKNFNIEDIYSQAVPVEPTHYNIDSFVVHDDYDNEDFDEQNKSFTEDKSLCPLEKAERILKERRREAKRRRNAQNEIEMPTKRPTRKCYQLKESDSSECDEATS